MINRKKISRLYICFLILSLMIIPGIGQSAQSSVCARVTINIQQELTLERQAFDAQMIINNGLTNIPLKDITINIHFTNANGTEILASSDPNNTAANFFYKVETSRMKNITNINGTGKVDPSTSAEIHWLIIPSTGSAKGQQNGTLYYVGATLSYTIAGKEKVLKVSPDHIYVKPMPELMLDYFLPTDVYGDDPETTDVQEPSIPFSLGVLVRNNGKGTAKSLKINSAQPKIIDNDQGLLINFIINSCEVNGKAAKATLLADFGDIKPSSAGIARWMISTTLSGKFVNFTADYTHSDDYGGVLTSLMTGISTHFLVHDVLVDLPARDNIRDFLAKQSSTDGYWVYESNNLDFAVRDVSDDTTFTCDNLSCNISSVETAGFIYLQKALQGQLTGQESIKRVVRSDGKVINTNNVWISKTRTKLEPWKYYINLFDVNTTGSYTIEFQNYTSSSLAIAPIADKVVIEGNNLSFSVTASGAQNITLNASTLPAKATFADSGSGSGLFSWTPSEGQSGKYYITFTATSGSYSVSKNALIVVYSSKDTDGDGMMDWWEMKYFGTLGRDGTGDYDGDGISDIDEYNNNTDPAQPNLCPSIPEIVYPQDNTEINTVRPVLQIRPSTDANDDEISYVYELYTEKEFRNLYLNISVSSTTWEIPEYLNNHTWYYWRVRSTDGKSYSRWAYGKFFINIANEPPNVPRLSEPASGSEVNTLNPLFEILNSYDEDMDGLTYIFEVYANAALDNLLYSSEQIVRTDGSVTFWRLNWDLKDMTQYWWKVKTIDEHGLIVESASGSFKVDLAHNAPAKPEVVSPSVEEIQTREVNLITSATTPAIEGYYIFEIDTSMTFNSENLVTSAPIKAISEMVSWNLTGLADNTRYYWRVCASNGTAFSQWTYSTFFVNTANEAPEAPTIKNPGNDAWETTLTPTLEVNPSTDPDMDALRYQIEVFSDELMANPVQNVKTDSTEWTLPEALHDKTWYYWRARAIDEHNAVSQWTYSSRFFVRDDGINEKPDITIISPSHSIVSNGNSLLLKWTDSDEDSNANISLYYDTDLTGNNGVMIAQGIKEDPDGIGDSYLWDLTGISEGIYYVYAVISNGSNTTTRYCSNSITIDRQAPIVMNDPQPGKFDGPLQVTITTNEDADIYYTTDESDPIGTSMVYSHPILINKTTTLKVKAIDKAGNESSVITTKYIVHETLYVTVKTSGGALLNNITVSGFNENGSYSGNQAVTNEEGVASFNVEDFNSGYYKFQAEYLGSKFWGSNVKIPELKAAEIIIPDELVQITIPTTNGPTKGIPVYIYSEDGTYLGVYALTNNSGVASFRLPVGVKFMFGTVVNGAAIFSNVTTVNSGSTTSVVIDTVNSNLKVTLKGGDNFLNGITIYLYNSNGDYLNMGAVTDAFGEVGFKVSPGIYRLRADYLGYQFWKDVDVKGDSDFQFVITHHQVKISVEGDFRGDKEPMEGMMVEIFTPTGVSTGLKLRTDALGAVSFYLPDVSFMACASYLGHEYWSDFFKSESVTITVPLAEAQVILTGGGFLSDNIKIYAYSPIGDVRGDWAETLGSDRVTFRLPTGAYKFMVELMNEEYWSTTEMLTEDTTTSVTIPVGGGLFTLQVLKAKNSYLKGLNAYAYNDLGDIFMNRSGSTNSKGKVSFDLSKGLYRFRVDYMGYQYWSDIYDVMKTLVGTMTITHKNVTVRVSTIYKGESTLLKSLKLYLYTGDGTDTGVYKTTNALGSATFSLPPNAFKVMMGYLGKTYWSDPFNQSDMTVNIPLGQVTANLKKAKTGAVVKNYIIYLYASDGVTYLNKNGKTDSKGNITMLLPERDFILRAGSKYYSPVFTITRDQTVKVQITM